MFLNAGHSSRRINIVQSGTFAKKNGLLTLEGEFKLHLFRLPINRIERIHRIAIMADHVEGDPW